MEILIVLAALLIGALIAFWSFVAIAFWPITLFILAILVAKAGAHELAWLIPIGTFAAMIFQLSLLKSSSAPADRPGGGARG